MKTASVARANVSAPPTNENGPAAPTSAPASLPNVVDDGTGSAPLRIAFSRDPGFAHWDNVAKSGAFTRRQLTVQLAAYEHAASLEAFSAGRADAVAATNAEVLIGRSLGSPCTAISVSWMETASPAVYARRKVVTLADLKGETIGIELGQPEHLAVERALDRVGIGKEVRLVNVVPEIAHRDFEARKLDAVVLPHALSRGFAKRVKAAHLVEGDGGARLSPLTYGLLCVRAASLATRRADWAHVVEAWQESASAAIASSARPSEDAPVSLIARPSRDIRHAVINATRDIDAFHVRQGAYATPLFEALLASDVQWMPE